MCKHENIAPFKESAQNMSVRKPCLQFPSVKTSAVVLLRRGGGGGGVGGGESTINNQWHTFTKGTLLQNTAI